jgi:hypothetical protein
VPIELKEHEEDVVHAGIVSKSQKKPGIQADFGIRHRQGAKPPRQGQSVAVPCRGGGGKFARRDPKGCREVDLPLPGGRLYGETIDFVLSPQRDTMAAKHFLQMALWRSGQMSPRVINVDGHAAYSAAIAELQQTGEFGQRCQWRPCPYLNNVHKQDHRFVKKRMAASLCFRSVGGVLRAIEGYEPMNMIRKGQVRWSAKNDINRAGSLHRAGVRDRRIGPH